MTKLWKEVKKYVKMTNVADECFDKKTGECTVDLIGGKFNGWAVAGKIVELGTDFEELVIDDEAIVYDPTK